MYYYDKAEPRDVEEMSGDECRTELDELRDEYEKLQLIDQIETLIRKLPTAIELRKALEATREVYEEAANNWQFLYPVRDNIVQIANNFTDDLRHQELNMLCAAMIDYCERNGDTWALEGVRATPSMYPYLKAAMESRQAKKQNAG